MKYIVTVYAGSKVYDQFYTYSQDAAERQGNTVAKWARYHYPDTMVLTAVKRYKHEYFNIQTRQHCTQN